MRDNPEAQWSREGSCILLAFSPWRQWPPCFALSVTCDNSESRSKLTAIKIEPLSVHLLAPLHCPEEIERCLSVHCDRIVQPMAAGRPHTFLRNRPPSPRPCLLLFGELCRLPVERRLSSITMPPHPLGPIQETSPSGGGQSANAGEFTGVLR